MWEIGSFPTMAIFLGHTLRNHGAPKYSACLENVCGIRDTVSSLLWVASIFSSLRRKNFLPSKKAQWLSGLQGRETHFIFLLHWQAG